MMFDRLRQGLMFQSTIFQLCRDLPPEKLKWEKKNGTDLKASPKFVINMANIMPNMTESSL